MSEIKSYKDLSVKAYAKLIAKSDKTVYKMIKDGLLAAKKKDKGYSIRVDNFMLNRCDDITESMCTMKDLMQSFESRLKKLEEGGQKKSMTKKTKLSVKKPLSKMKKSVKSPKKKLRKLVKINVKK